MKYVKSEKGFTLVELLVGMAIMVIIFSGLVPLFSNMLTITSRGMTDNDLMQEARWAMTLMKRDISCGNLIVTPTSTTKGNSLTFRRWDTASDITYSIVNNEVCRQVGAAGIRSPITDRGRAPISGLDFTRSANGENVTIMLTLRMIDARNVQHEEKVSSTVFLLNNNAGIGGN